MVCVSPRTLKGALVALPVIGGALVATAVVLDHAGQDVYGIPGWGVGVTIALSSLVLLGAGAILWSRQPALSAVVLVGAALGAFGVVAMLSIGPFALIPAGGLLWWASAHRWTGPHRTRATVGAALAGAPLPVLVVFAMAGPLVECAANGSSSGENVFMALGSSGGSGTSVATSSSSLDATAGGHASGDGYEYSYECRDGRLVRFALRRQ
jgi:hypothetical protein